MALAAAYDRQMKALLPPGKIWRKVASVLADFFLACAQELERVDQRGQDLINEADPRTTTELLPDFERVYKLVASGSIDERRARLVAAVIRRQRVRPVDYQQVLAPLLQQDPEDVVVRETTHAQAVSTGDEKEIYRFFIYRNPALAGTADLVAAQALVDKMSHSHTKGVVIETLGFIVDDPHSIVDRDIIGA